MQSYLCIFLISTNGTICQEVFFIKLLTNRYKAHIIAHFRQLGNQKETLMVEIPTVASPSPLFEVLYQQHLSKFF